MNDITMDADMFSSMEGELISNIKRPSLLSLSSEDSLDDKMGNEETLTSPYFKTSTPFKRDIVDDTICEKSDDGLDDYAFKMTGNQFPSSRSGKRYSLANCNEASRLYSCIMNKSSSMQDVSSLASSFCPLRRDSCMFSTETLQSNSIATTKSKDSGFQRSTSCTSLTTNASKKYDHVQSKVKQYIQNIKQTEAVRKMQRQLEKQASMYAETSGVTTAHTTSADSAAEVSQSPSPDSSPISKRDLLQKVKALEDELKERDCVIEQLEKNQSELRLKYAAAENQIDDLRIRASVHEDPLKNYISDEKVAELLTNNVKLTTRKYMDNAITKQLMRNMKRTDVTAFVRPGDSCAGSVRDLLPITKFGSNSVRMGDEYKVLKSKTDTGILKSSSCKWVKEECYDLAKSASNVDRASVRFADSDMMELPYEKNSFAKVQNWQRSLVNLSRHHDDPVDEVENDMVRASCRSRGPAGGHYGGCCALTDDSAEENRRKTRRYLKNKDANKRRYQQRRSYPAVGCRCEKYKCKSKEDVSSGGGGMPLPHAGKLVRSVSFASCEESLTSSMYDDGGSSSDEESAVFVAGKHETYKEYKQRKLQQRFGSKSSRRDRSPKWTAADLQKAKSAGSLAATRSAADCAALVAAQSTSQRHKRLLDNSPNSSYEFSCSSDRKQQQQYSASKTHQHRNHQHHHHHHHTNKSKYRKLDDCAKVVAAGGCNPLVKCRSSHACRSQGTGGYEEAGAIQHSKSFDACSRGHDKESGHRLNKVECSCLTALENMKIKEHNAFLKFAEHMRKNPLKTKEKEMPVAYKRYSLQK